MNCLSAREIKLAACYAHSLLPAGRQMHFDPAEGRIPNRLVRESIQVEISAKFAIDPDKKILVELRRHALRIVIRREKGTRLFHKIDRDKEFAARTKGAVCASQEFGRFRDLQVSDGRPREETQPGAPANRFRQYDVFPKIGSEGPDSKAGKRCNQGLNAAPQRILADVDGDI